MPVPIEPYRLTSYEITQKLREKGYTEGYYAELQAEMDSRNERSKSVEHLISERKKARAKVSKPKKRGQLDSKSVEHTFKNTLITGGVAGPVLVGKEVLGIYDELKARGIAPTEETVLGVVKAQGFSEATIVYFWTAIIIACVGTILWKLTKEYG